MILSGIPGISGPGSFIMSRGFSFPVIVVDVQGIFEGTLTSVDRFLCTISPQNPIALIKSVEKNGITMTLALLQSENTIPQT